MTGIHDDAQAFEIHSFWKGSLRILDIPAERIINADSFADFLGGGPNVFNRAGKNQVFDFKFDIVVEFVTVVLEKFDAVVFVRIVRSSENDAGIGAERTSDVRHARRWQRTNHQHIYAHRKHTGGNGVFEHITREPCVFPDDDAMPAESARQWYIFLEHIRRRAPELERSFGGDRFDVGNAAYAVGSKKFPTNAVGWWIHNWLLHPARRRCQPTLLSRFFETNDGIRRLDGDDLNARRMADVTKRDGSRDVPGALLTL